MLYGGLGSWSGRGDRIAYSLLWLGVGGRDRPGGTDRCEGGKVCGPWSIKIRRAALLFDGAFGGDIVEKQREKGLAVRLNERNGLRNERQNRSCQVVLLK